MSEEERILRDYIKEKTKSWIVDGKSFSMTDFAEKLLDSICEFVYKPCAIDLKFSQDQYVEIFQHPIRAEFLKRQKKETTKCINYCDFAMRFLEFEKCLTKVNINGNLSQKIKDVLGLRHNDEELNNKEKFFLKSKCKDFFKHYVNKDDTVKIEDVTISDDALTLYVIMFTVWIYGKDCGDIQIENFRIVLKNYRKKTSAKLEMQKFVFWCMQCYSELFLYNQRLFMNETVPEDKKISAVTIYGINEFLDQFSFAEVTVKCHLRNDLLDCFKREKKKIPFDEFNNFMTQFRLDSLNTEIPFMGRFGSGQKKGKDKNVRYASTNFQFIKKYLQEYFAPQFNQDFVYKYFDFSVDPEALNNFSKEDEIEMWENKEYNHLISYIFILLDPPKDNYLSICAFWCLWNNFLKQMQEVNENDNMTEWIEKYLVLRGILKHAIEDINNDLAQTEEACKWILDNFKSILKSGKLNVSTEFLDKLWKIDGSNIKKANDEEICWKYKGDIDKVLTEIYLRAFR